MNQTLRSGPLRRLLLRAMCTGLGICTALFASSVRAEDHLPASLNVKNFDVRGGAGKAQSAQIQGAVDACAAAGGCTLVFPAGRYVTGTIFLRDAVHLHLEPGAVLAASRDPKDYPAPALLYARGLDGVTISGSGEIQGAPVKDEKDDLRLTALVYAENSINLRIHNLRLTGAPAYSIALRVVDRAWVENVSIETDTNSLSASGLALDSSSRISVRGIHYKGGGEGIVLQSNAINGTAPPCEGISISDSTITSSTMAFKVGTRSFGPIRQINVSNLVIARSQGGVGIFARDGGAVEDIQFNNLQIDTTAVNPKMAEWPLIVDLKRREQESAASTLRGIRFQGVQIRTAGKVVFSGMTHHPIRDLQVEGLRLSVEQRDPGGIVIERPWKSAIDQVSGEDSMAAAIVAGYLADATLRDVRVMWQQADPSPEGHALFLHSSDGVRLDGWHARQAKKGGTQPTFSLMSSRGVEVRNSTAPPDTGVWLHLQKMQKEDIFTAGNQTAFAYRELVVAK